MDTGALRPAKPHGPRLPAQRGFTLLEVLVAFTIMAIVLVGLLQAFSRGMDTIVAAERHTRLLAEAENVLAQVGPEIPLQRGFYSGRSGGYDWQVEIEPAEDADPETAALTRMQLLAVDVLVTGPQGAEQRLRTLRLGVIQ